MGIDQFCADSKETGGLKALFCAVAQGGVAEAGQDLIKEQQKQYQQNHLNTVDAAVDCAVNGTSCPPPKPRF